MVSVRVCANHGGSQLLWKSQGRMEPLHVARSPLSHERPHVESLRHECCHEPLLWGVGYISSTVMAVEHAFLFLFVLSMCLLDVFA